MEILIPGLGEDKDGRGGVGVNPDEVRCMSAAKAATMDHQIPESPSRPRKDQSMNDKVVAAIRRIAAELGTTTLSHGAYMKHLQQGEPSGITAIRRFGTWKKAVLAAGLEPHPYSRGGEVRVTDSEALSLIRHAAADYSTTTGNEGSRMTQAYYRQWRQKNGGLGLENLVKRYGLWVDVKRHAGLL